MELRLTRVDDHQSQEGILLHQHPLGEVARASEGVGLARWQAPEHRDVAGSEYRDPVRHLASALHELCPGGDGDLRRHPWLRVEGVHVPGELARDQGVGDLSDLAYRLAERG